MSTETNSSRRAGSNDVLKNREMSKTPTFEAKCDLDMDEFTWPQTKRKRREIENVYRNELLSSSYYRQNKYLPVGKQCRTLSKLHCGMKPLVQLAENFEIINQRIPYFSWFSTSFWNLKYSVLSSPNMFRRCEVVTSWHTAFKFEIFSSDCESHYQLWKIVPVISQLWNEREE